MDFRLQIKTAQFNEAMAEMYRRLGDVATQRQIIDFEVGKVVEGALRRTETATSTSIRASAASKQWTTLNGKKYKLAWRVPSPTWRDIAAARRAVLDAKLAARGLAKRSWLALGEALGVTVEAPGYVTTAKAKNHTSGENVSVDRKSSPDGYGLRIDNSSPLLRWTEGRQAFFAAVAGRIEFFKRNLRSGVFGDLDKAARKYRGLVVRGN